ncbi:MAG TPA: phosphatidate cytidylyltransferase [Thermohalobaculum sp.]|nr:phosphatidate cytidylyltransferase [Thermohalobaculum sp.]
MSDFLGVAPEVMRALVALFVLLAGATVLVRFIAPDPQSELRQRMRSWWFMIGIFAAVMVIDRVVATIFLGFISFLALKEYLSLIPTRRIARFVLLWAYLAIPVQFYLAHIGWYGMYIVFIPVWMFLFLPLLMTLMGETKGFLTAVGTLSWGLMMTVFSLSHTAMLLGLDPAIPVAAGGAGLLLFLVVATQFNDVAQFVTGKLFGRRPIVPTVSPKKTWEGFLGGLAATTLLAAAMGPYLTVMDLRWSALAGAMIAVAGFCGDITISALKRDLGVKDASHLIPGHGGILDRIDSLTYAAPVFFHFYFYFFFYGFAAQ